MAAEEETLRRELSPEEYCSYLQFRGEAAGRKYHGVAPRLNGKWQARKTHYKVLSGLLSRALRRWVAYCTSDLHL
jgi:hypothetical protein